MTEEESKKQTVFDANTVYDLHIIKCADGHKFYNADVTIHKKSDFDRIVSFLDSLSSEDERPCDYQFSKMTFGASKQLFNIVNLVGFKADGSGWRWKSLKEDEWFDAKDSDVIDTETMLRRLYIELADVYTAVEKQGGETSDKE